MQGKKGFLLGEETLKIVIAVICIMFLAYLLFSLYNAHKKNKELELAKDSLNHLIDEINAESTQAEIHKPRGWFFTSFPQDIGIKSEVFPKSCSNLGWSTCICICKVKLYSQIDRQCDKDGFCLEEEFIVEGEKLHRWQEDSNSIIISKDLPLILIIKDKTISKK